MTPPTDDISGLVFKRSDLDSQGEFTLDAPTLNALLSLDGKTPLGEIARRLNLDMPAIRQIMTRLAKMKLIVRVAAAQAAMPTPVVDFLKKELARAMGPIAETLFDDVLDDLRLPANRIPKSKGPELVEMLAQEIPDDRRRIAFIKAMLPRLQ